MRVYDVIASVLCLKLACLQLGSFASCKKCGHYDSQSQSSSDSDIVCVCSNPRGNKEAARLIIIVI